MRTITLCSLYAGLLSVCAVFNTYGREPSSVNAGQFTPQPAPFVFLENKGQVIDQFKKPCTDVDFKLSGEGITVFIGNGSLKYQWVKTVTVAGGKDVNSQGLQFCNLSVSLDGANKKAVLIKEQPAKYHENYYLPQCPGGAVAHSFGKLTYKDIYPNIDWVLYINAGKLKYDFIVHPGGKVSDIKLNFSGDSAMAVNNGKFTAHTKLGSIEEDAPYAYQVQKDANGREVRTDVPVNFALNDSQLSFEAAAHEGTLVIDPTISWSRYYGWVNTEILRSVATQRAGAGNPIPLDFLVYFVGKTNSYGNISWANGHPIHQSVLGEPYTNSGEYDGFVVAVSAGGIREWATYYGGDSTDELVAGAVDNSGNLYVVGNTRSTLGITTAGAYKTTPGGEQVFLASQPKDGFIAKLKKDGSREWGTFYGGNNWEEMRGVTLDNAGSIYVTGWTYSTSGMTTSGTYQPAHKGGKEAFLGKLNNNGTSLLWGTYYGAGKNEEGNAVVCDRSGNVYLAGLTSEDTCGRYNNPAKDTAIATPGAFQFWPANRVQQLCPLPPPPQVPPPDKDGFLVKFYAANGARQWGTFYGGVLDDQVNTMTFDTTRFITPAGNLSNGLLYIGGVAQSISGISSPEGWQSTFGGGQNDGFVAAFLPTGERYWATYLGGTGVDDVKTMAVDPQGALVVGGQTNSAGLATTDAYQKVCNGMDGFVVVYNQGFRQSYTYFGGGSPPPGTDMLYGVACDDAGFIYIAGSTTSSDSINVGTPVTSYSGFPYEDAFMARFIGDFTSYYKFGPLPPGNFLCPNLPYSTGMDAMHNVNTSNMFLPGNTYIVQMSDINGSFLNAKNIGTGSGSVVSFTVPVNTPPGVGYKLRAISSRPLMISASETFGVSQIPYPQVISDSVYCEGDTIKLTATDTITTGIMVAYKWVNSDTSVIYNTKDTTILNGTVAHGGRYIISAAADNTCYAADTVNITVNTKPVITSVANNSPVCEGVPVNITADADTTGGGQIKWNGPGGFSSNDKDPVINPTTVSKLGAYTLKLTRNGCSDSATTVVQINPQPKINDISSNSPVCYEDTIRLFSATEPPAAVFTWTGPQGFTSTQPNTIITNSGNQHKGYYKLSGVLGNCTVTDSVLVDVTQIFTIDAGSNSPVTVGSDIKLTASDVLGAAYTWTGPNGFTSTDKDPVITNAQYVHAGPYIVVARTPACKSSAKTIVEIKDAAGVKKEESLYPNPNNGNFTLRLVLANDYTIPAMVTNKLGQKVYEFKVVSQNKLVEEKIVLPALAAGTYNLMLIIGKETKVIPFAIGE